MKLTYRIRGFIKTLILIARALGILWAFNTTGRLIHGFYFFITSGLWMHGKLVWHAFKNFGLPFLIHYFIIQNFVVRDISFAIFLVSLGFFFHVSETPSSQPNNEATPTLTSSNLPSMVMSGYHLVIVNKKRDNSSYLQKGIDRATRQLKKIFSRIFGKWGAIIILSIFYLLIKFLVPYLEQIFKYRINIQSFSRASIKSRDYSQAIKFIAYEIWKLSFKWNHKGRRIEKILKKEEVSKLQIFLLRCRIDLIKREDSKTYQTLLLIHYGMHELATILNIKASRISDELFHFSPGILKNEILDLRESTSNYIAMRYFTFPSLNNPEFQKSNFLRHWFIPESVKEEKKKFYKKRPSCCIKKEFKQKLEKEKSQIKRLKEKYKKRSQTLQTICKDQIEVFRNTGLHSQLTIIAEGTGISSSLEVYIFGFQNIMRRWKSLESKFFPENLKKKFRFWYSRRRLGGGVDLHLLFYLFLKKESHLLANELKSFTPYFNQSEKNLYSNPEIQISFLSIANEYQKKKKEYREKISEIFLRTLEEQLSEWNPEEKPWRNIERIIFVTHGFSSVVRSVLKAVAAMDEESNDNQFNYFNILNVQKSIFILFGPEDQESEHLTTTRYLRYKYKASLSLDEESEENHSKKGLPVNIGDMNWLLNNVSTKNTALIILSGAELIFNASKGTPEAFVNTEEEFWTQLTDHDIRFKHYVLAESFKKVNHEDLKIDPMLQEEAYSKEFTDFCKSHKAHKNLKIITD